MPKHFRRDGYRVTVETRLRARFGGVNGGAKTDADKIADLIKKHVGCDFTEAESPDVEEFGEEVCSHCGQPWTEDDSRYNGGCCDKDQAEEEARIAAVAQAERDKNKPTMPEHILTERDNA